MSDGLSTRVVIGNSIGGVSFLVIVILKKRKSDDKLEDFTMDINKMAATKRNSAVRSCSDVVVTTTM
ncbi:hypothetical protein HID58_021834 [Brassica napus]|uniref:Uncharacterized protein n=1 Tax=Brassica napus TaxID=3708 RepID=A0ABQ8CZX6_BRANA|nr:hypothetical protein HID58_021834 [Brassica napus]